MASARTYRHFCPLARALELVGERWGLLIVRDLLAGPQRFTDLVQTCGGITPRQLATRLHQLEEAGIVEREQAAGRREVWYRLTSTGADLRPAVEGLLVWGMKHARRPPTRDEPVRPEHVLNGTRLALDSAPTKPSALVSWVFRFGSDAHTLRFDGAIWQLEEGENRHADVIVDTTPRDWARIVMAGNDQRASVASPHLQGGKRQVREFRTIFGMLVC